MLRKTKATAIVLQRLADAAGVRLRRDGKLWLVHTADIMTPGQVREWREWGFSTKPRPQNSTKALAGLALHLFEKYGKVDPNKWEALRQGVRLTPAPGGTVGVPGLDWRLPCRPRACPAMKRQHYRDLRLRRWFDMGGGSYGQDDVFVIWTMAIIWTLLLTAGLLEWFFERRKK